MPGTIQIALSERVHLILKKVCKVGADISFYLQMRQWKQRVVRSHNSDVVEAKLIPQSVATEPTFLI